jgi:hypothetical protein
MSVADDGISVVRWAEAVRLMTELLPHVSVDDVQTYQDVMMLISKRLLEAGDNLVSNGGSV